jgi:hypothetical protein
VYRIQSQNYAENIMDSEEFVSAIRKAIIDGAASDIIEMLENPPGRKPSANLIANSVWYKSLSQEQKRGFGPVIQDAVESSVFGFLCVLDGVRAIENGPGKGRLELRYIKDDQTTIINPEILVLHDLL